jgi:uncharacterized RDD family membrane protein YckC
VSLFLSTGSRAGDLGEGDDERVRWTTTRTAFRRVAAWCLDWLIISAYAGALIPLGLVLDRSVRLPLIGWNALAFVLLVVPTTLWLAGWEAGTRAATPGKRVLQLRVDRDGTRPSWRRSMARNALKVALPWELGHTAAFTLASRTSSTTAQVMGMVCGTVACGLVLAYLVSLFVGLGRTPYDRVVGTAVNVVSE